ncbi:MAG TPA: serine protease [Prevotellaceae bacterium]|nr:serine protease [Prevotellaceae bacterium]
MHTMKKSFTLTLILLGVIVASCGNKSEQQIEDTAASGVVLVQNQSYYELVMPNGNSIYFSRFDEDGDVTGLAMEADSVEATITYGTGFFVSANGEIATNAHVVDNMMEEKAANRSVTKVFNGIQQIVKAVYDDYKDKYESACTLAQLAFFDDNVSAAEYQGVCEVRDAYKSEMEECAEMYNNIGDLKASDCDLKYHNTVSIAYNDTYVTSTQDFQECVMTKTDHDHDLAIIQLKDKKTPADNYVFPIPGEDPLETYSLMDNLKKKTGSDKNSKLYMLSFNLGPTLAITKEGIKSQFNNGTISQKTSERLMYSIPALHGSSGSPVLNHEGELVAVNFAGLSNTQNFNYGIRVKYLRELIEE